MRFRKMTMSCYTAYEEENMAEAFLFLMGEECGPASGFQGGSSHYHQKKQIRFVSS